MMYSYRTGRYEEYYPFIDFTRKYLWSLVATSCCDKSVIATSTGVAMTDFNNGEHADSVIESIIYDSDPSYWNNESELGDINHPTYWKDKLGENSQGIYSGVLAIYDPDLETNQEDLVEYRFQFIPVSIIKEHEGGVITKEEDF